MAKEQEQNQAKNPDKEIDVVWVKINKAFVKFNLQNKETGAKFHSVTLPKGVTIGGKDLGGYSFYTKTITKDKFKENLCDIPIHSDRQIHLKKEIKIREGVWEKSDPVIVTPLELKDAVNAAYKIYIAENKDKIAQTPQAAEKPQTQEQAAETAVPVAEAAENAEVEAAEPVLSEEKNESEPSKEEPQKVVVARYQSTHNMQEGYVNDIAIIKEADGYHNHFFYNDEAGTGSGGSGPFDKLEDAIQDVKAHYPDAREGTSINAKETGAQAKAIDKVQIEKMSLDDRLAWASMKVAEQNLSTPKDGKQHELS